MIARVVYLDKLTFSSLRGSLSVVSLPQEHEARLDWIPFSPAVVCIRSHV